MPRGQKTCNVCGKSVGPRSWSCSGCGSGFIIQGIQKPDIDPASDTPNPARLNVKPTAKQRLWNLMELYDEEDDQRFRKRYDVEGKTWQSKCGCYRVREQFTFMGVDMQANFGKCVYLLKKRGNTWDVVKPKGKFGTVFAAIRRMVKDSNGQKVKATTRAEKLDIRVSKMMGRKVSYA